MIIKNFVFLITNARNVMPNNIGESFAGIIEWIYIFLSETFAKNYIVIRNMLLQFTIPYIY